MIPVFQKQERRVSTLKHYNTVNSSKGMPAVFIKHFPTKKTFTAPIKPYKYPSKLIQILRFVSAHLSILQILLLFYETELVFSSNFVITNNINLLRSLILVICLLHSMLVVKILMLRKIKVQKSF